MEERIIASIIAVILIFDVVFYVKAINKYGNRWNLWPFSGYYEWFIRKEKINK